MGGTIDGVTLIDPATVKLSAELEPRAQGVTDINLDSVTRTCKGGTSWVQSVQGYKVPAEYPPESAKGDGWTWRGWFGFGGSHMQFEPDHKCASSYVMVRLAAFLREETFPNVVLWPQRRKCSQCAVWTNGVLSSRSRSSTALRPWRRSEAFVVNEKFD